MEKYKLSFWFEHGGGYLWGKSKETQDKYGYCVNALKLPISSDLYYQLQRLSHDYIDFLDWSDPGKSCQWTQEQKVDFLNKSNEVYDSLIRELGSDYEVTNDVRERSLNNEV